MDSLNFLLCLYLHLFISKKKKIKIKKKKSVQLFFYCHIFMAKKHSNTLNVKTLKNIIGANNELCPTQQLCRLAFILNIKNRCFISAEQIIEWCDTHEIDANQILIKWNDYHREIKLINECKKLCVKYQERILPNYLGNIISFKNEFPIPPNQTLEYCFPESGGLWFGYNPCASGLYKEHRDIASIIKCQKKETIKYKITLTREELPKASFGPTGNQRKFSAKSSLKININNQLIESIPLDCGLNSHHPFFQQDPNGYLCISSVDHGILLDPRYIKMNHNNNNKNWLEWSVPCEVKEMFNWLPHAVGLIIISYAFLQGICKTNRETSPTLENTVNQLKKSVEKNIVFPFESLYCQYLQIPDPIIIKNVPFNCIPTEIFHKLKI